MDLYNEGVDIPEVDTILFLRPTESLTVFLQQLGSGHFTNSCELHKYLASVQVAYMGSFLCRSIDSP